ncbi:hypothetical protein NEOLI_004196 [Neolecta irregularis DAH-3]|uniref:Uncharacterized protein n=1 Tax=Neolecta irregularis (strain DAH-3) TaxID=1198029 RepID=A0A1U7LRN8_NEOID|nr:hypothetical protein NEOLI_004196 [Neolecta irregularis DAH-3]|eukprot:OLL25288.1 hypothetical protein NEOLI_004196 [Neolecta irregularis DAH-3]
MKQACSQRTTGDFHHMLFDSLSKEALHEIFRLLLVPRRSNKSALLNLSMTCSFILSEMEAWANETLISKHSFSKPILAPPFRTVLFKKSFSRCFWCDKEETRYGDLDCDVVCCKRCEREEIPWIYQTRALQEYLLEKKDIVGLNRRQGINMHNRKVPAWIYSLADIQRVSYNKYGTKEEFEKIKMERDIIKENKVKIKMEGDLVKENKVEKERERREVLEVLVKGMGWSLDEYIQVSEVQAYLVGGKNAPCIEDTIKAVKKEIQQV